MDALNLSQPALAPHQQPASTTRKTVEYLYATMALGGRVVRADAAMHDPSLRWCLLEYRIDDDDIGRELSRYISLSAPKAIVAARRALADAKAVHPGDLSTLELDFNDAEQRWTNACKQKIQALRVKLTEMRAHTAPDAHAFVLSERRVEGGAVDRLASTRILAPHYFIYLAPAESMASESGHVDVASVSQTMPLPRLQLRARNYIGGWLQEENVEVAVVDVAWCGWPLPAFQRWIQGVVALRRKAPRDEGAAVPVDCVLAAGESFCLVMDLPTFVARNLPQDR
ncbi:hypothetical protein [Paraburkholderia sp. PGU19]|uniref:hypothetical protein n=1 Tax=Paraburkholderia sp. PGU19 TaxID=2735434 RepID=UPI001FB074F1|nr:hypothetical protein [Paraburkholderia sp. PGU19]